MASEHTASPSLLGLSSDRNLLPSQSVLYQDVCVDNLSTKRKKQNQNQTASITITPCHYSLNVAKDMNVNKKKVLCAYRSSVCWGKEGGVRLLGSVCLLGIIRYFIILLHFFFLIDSQVCTLESAGPSKVMLDFW